MLVNGKGVVQVEYFYDTVPAYGQGIQYTAFTQGSTVTINNALLSAAGISDGFHRLGIRAKAGGPNGLWSPVYWQNVIVNGAGITQVEYYWDDAHPAHGAATPLTGFTPGSIVTITNSQISTAGLATGVHRLALRARSGNGMWSPTYFHEVFVGSGADYAEYYWDTDPGYGQATPIAFTPGEVAMVNISNIAVPTSDGLHTLAIRARAGKTWSPTYIKTYCNAPTPMFSLLGSDTVCQGEQIIILDETEGASAQTQYTWDMQSDGTVDDQTAGDLTYTYAQPGIYELTLGVGNNATCQNTYSKTIVVRSTQNPTISISRNLNNVCEGTEVRFVATTQRAANYSPQIMWFRNDTLMPGITGDTIYLSDLHNNDRIRAKVRVYNPCASADSAQSSQLTMQIYPLPSVTMQHQRFIFSDEQAFTLTSRFAGTPTGGTYSINGTNTTLFNPTRNENGIYTISYTYTNNNGCSTTVVDSFELRDRVEYMLTAQSANPLQGTVSGSGMYTIGDTATATAIGALGWRFDHWNDGDTTNPRRIEMMGNTTLTAYWHHLCNDTVIVDSANVCDSYQWHGTTYTTSTTEATHTVPSALGCDSTHQLHLTVRHSNTGTETAVACDTYIWHGTVYNASSNTGTHTSTNAAGCDSLTTLHLTINHSNEGSETITACDSYQWHGTTFTSSNHNATYTCPNVHGCDSLTTLHLTVNHSNAATQTVSACDSYTWHGSIYSTSTNTPSYTSTNMAGCDSVTTLHLTVNYSNSAIETVTACNSFVWHGSEYTASTSTPTYTSTNAAGCDSVTTLHLTINHCSTTNITACDSYTWHGTTYTTSGTYTDGTDTLALTINYSNAAVEAVTACNSFVWQGTTYTASTNTPTHTNTNAAGCDSVTTLHLTINHCSTADITACDSYTWHGASYTTSGTYTDGTDTLMLTINYSNAAVKTITACNSFVWHGTTYTTSTNTPTYTSTNMAGCDSVTTLHLTVNYSNSAIETVTACNSFVWHGSEYTASTSTPTYTSTNAAGCDSVTTLHLTINHCSTADITACDSYTWHGTTYTTSGTYTDGTDTLMLTINYSNAAVETITACNSFVWHGTTYTTSTNTPTYTSTNVAGCDSVTTLHLTVNYSNTSVETVTACNSFVWHGTEYTASTNTPTYTTVNVVGCDSVTTLHLTINHCSTTDVTTCESYTWHGTTYTTSGTYTYGTDTLALTINYNNSAIETATVCDAYTWHGTVYTASTNTPTHTSTNVAGCDSVTTLHLTVNYSNTSVETVTACNSFVWHGTEYTASTNTPTYTTVNVVGCDSVTTLHLTINHCSTTDVTACDSYTWHGTTYTTDGTYTDGTDTLVLTINHSNSSVETVTACDAYTWHGVLYTSSTNTPQYITTNAQGCDSTVTLNLTIVPSLTITYDANGGSGTMSNQSACPGQPTILNPCTFSRTGYAFDGWAITPAGSVMFTDGAEVVLGDNVTLYAVWLQTCVDAYSTSLLSACDSLVWRNSTYLSSGSYVDTVYGAVVGGCDSIYTLQLTLNHSNDSEEHAVACDSLVWNGTTYIESNTNAIAILTNNAGCDSTVTLHLTINHSVHHTIDTTAHDSITWNGSTYTESGVYSWTGTTIDGCDSTVVLNLTIIERQGIVNTPTSQIVLYPNPTGGIVTIEADNVANVEVYDIYGRRILNAEDTTIVDLEIYPSGSYTFRITTRSGVYIRKVIKR